jgi:oligoendopeptidase F
MTAAIPTALPPAALAEITWPEVEARYAALAAAPLTAESVSAWLTEWSDFESALTEAASLAMIAYTCDTTDKAKEAAHLRFSMEILPKAEKLSTGLARRLVESGLEPDGFGEPLRRFRQQIAIFREANVPLTSEVEQRAATYQKLTGGMTAEWNGQQLPLPRLQPYLLEADRSVRERAWRAMQAPYVAAREALAALFTDMRGLRQQIARNAGFAEYQAYAFAAKNRFDYTPADCRRFHEAVEQVVVPAVRRRYERRRALLGLETLRPWDLQVPTDGGDRSPAFASGQALAQRSGPVFAAVDPALGRSWQTMLEEHLLDLDSREGKAPGGYCDTLHSRGRPFIFMNAVGIDDDVTTLLHEAGHAFHAFEAHRHPLLWLRHPGSEACELASMSMELLAAPHLAEPVGLFSAERARRARRDHLEDVLGALPHIASVDAFQAWIYGTEAGADAAARDAKWLELRARFEQGVDWSGLEAERLARWYRQLHIFLYPFYYIEYGIAQLGALQVWRNAHRDGPDAIARYRDALALGATVPLPAIYAAAGARLIFDPEGMAELVELVETELERLDADDPIAEPAAAGRN